MEKRNMNQWIEEVIESQKKKALPVLSFPSIQKMGITLAELINDSEKQAEGMKLIADQFPSAASVSLMDLSLEAEAFGAQIRISDDEVPTVIGALISEEEEAEALEVPEIGAGRTQIYIDAIQKACTKITDRPVFAGVIGPFSLAGRLMGVSDALIYCFEEPDMVHIILEKATEFLIKYCKEYKKAGANGVVMAEPLAGLLSPALADEFSAEYVRRIVKEIQDEEFLMIYHNCGDSALKTIDTIVTNGCRAFHFGNVIDMEEIMKHIPDNMLAMGNVDPAGEFRNGTSESIYNATQEILRKCGNHSNFVISSGCDIPPMSPWENIDSFFKAVEDFYE